MYCVSHVACVCHALPRLLPVLLLICLFLINEHTFCVLFSCRCSTLFCVFSLVCAFAVAKIDKRFYRGYSGTSERNVTCADIRALGQPFWNLILIVFLSYCIIVPFHTILTDFLQTKWYSGDSVEAGRIMGIADIIGAVFVIPVGFVADRFGHRGLILALSSFCLFLSQLFLTLLDVLPLAALVIQGLGQAAFVAVVWPSVSLVVPAELLGYIIYTLLSPLYS